jgi:uncharacterized protein involved in type VI secretion and phage assembly
MTQDQIQLISPAVKVNGSPISEATAVALVSIDIDRALNLVGRATLRFVEPAFDLAVQPLFPLGADVEISVLDGTTLLSGTVTGFSLDQDLETAAGTTLTVVVDDAGHLMSRTSTHQAFLNGTYADALKAVISASKLTPSVESMTAVEEYILQSGTALSFLDWVCTRFGLQWWVSGKTVNVKKAGTSSATVPLVLGERLMRLSTRASDRHPSSVTVTGWDIKQQVQVTSTAQPDGDAESTIVQKFPARGGPPTGAVTLPAHAITTAEATSVSTSLLAQSKAAAVTVRGTAYVTPTLEPGTTVQITSAGTVSGSYFVSRVQHSYTRHGFQTHFTAGPLQPESLVDLLGGAPPSGGALAGTLATAVVTNNNDTKNEHPGQVKVKLFTVGAGVESQWARVVTLGGGANRGVVFHPEVGDEVLVGFENGDTRRPIVLGGLFSEKNALPSTDNVGNGKVSYRRITSRLGHIIELYDGESDAEKYVQLKTKGGHYVKVAEDKLELKVANKPITITNGPAKIEFSDKGNITIDGVDITIKGSGAVKIEGTSEATVKSTASAKLEGNVVEVKGTNAGSIDGGNALAVKGKIVAIN